MFNPTKLRLLQLRAKDLLTHGKKLIWWGVPAAAAGAWLAYPALTSDFKKSVGL